jgi:hypothetical protein
MRFLSPALLTGLFVASAPAVAQPAPANADTYRAIVEHGLVIVTPDIEIDVTFMPDGKFTALGGMAKGTWKIVGDKMCSTDEATMIETCAVYPAGKKSGDTFELDTPTGRVPVRIN